MTLRYLMVAVVVAAVGCGPPMSSTGEAPSALDDPPTVCAIFPSSEGCFDEDGDGVINLEDNCLFVANIDQSDVNQNGIGDACEVKPTVCLIRAGDGSDLRARFGYINDNPQQIAIPIGPDNVLTPLSGFTIDVGSQPAQFLSGSHLAEFELVFDHKGAVTWSLNGSTLTVDKHSPKCGK